MTTFTIKNSSTLYKITLADAKTVKIIEIKDSDGHSIDISQVKFIKFTKEGSKVYMMLKMNKKRRNFRVKQKDTKLLSAFIDDEKEVSKLRKVILKLRKEKDKAVEISLALKAKMLELSEEIKEIRANSAKVKTVSVWDNTKTMPSNSNTKVTMLNSNGSMARQNGPNAPVANGRQNGNVANGRQNGNVGMANGTMGSNAPMVNGTNGSMAKQNAPVANGRQNGNVGMANGSNGSVANGKNAIVKI